VIRKHAGALALLLAAQALGFASRPAQFADKTVAAELSGSAESPRGIEAVHFGDGTVYLGGKPHRLHKGQLASPDPDDPLLRVSVEPPAFGHVDGYSGELAAILIYSSDPGATGLFSELNVFALRAGKPELVADLPGGDRAEGGLHTAKIANGRLVVEVYAPPPSGGGCCPGFVDTVRYRFTGGKLVRDGKPSRRTAVQDKDY